MKKCFFIIVFALFAFVANAQTLPTKVEVFRPQILEKNIVTTTEVNKLINDVNWGQNSSVKNKVYWTVYSDRSDNAAYTNPDNRSAIKSKLQFKQEVRIAQIKNGYALVFKDYYHEKEYPLISQHAEVYGWVPMSKLLLWNSCPTNEFGIYHKALIAANISENTKNQKGNKYFGLYRNPEANPIDEIPSSMEFYFIMKKLDNNMALLSKACKIDSDASSEVLIGWVEEISYVPWNQRSCLEPNWHPEIVKYFRGSNNPVVDVYYDNKMSKDKALLYYDFRKGNNLANRYEKYRMDPYALRYPILDYNSDNTYKCNAFGMFSGEMNEAIMRKAQAERDLETLIAKVRNMNLMICIDGTKSMEPYFPAVKNAIAEAMKFIPNNITFKVGLVIYRDYSDGEGLVEYLPLLSSDDPRIKNFLDKGGKYGIKSSPADKTHTEALYKGMEVAIDSLKMGFSKDHNNFLLVVGDCGNARNDSRCVSSAELLNRMVKNNVQLLSFQVYRKNDSAWNLFSDQMSSLIQQNVQTRYQQLEKESGVAVKVFYEELTDGYQVKSKNLENLYLGTLRFGRMNEAMPAQKLKDLILESSKEFVNYIERKSDMIINPNAFNTTTSEDNVAAKINEAFVKELMGEESFKNAKERNNMISYIGYTPKTDENKKEYWKPVLFISGEELDQLLEKLEPVNKAAMYSSNDRKPYVEAMRALVRSMLPGISEAEMNAKGTQEIMNLINGLNVSTNSIKGPSLLQIQDPKAVPQIEYNKIIRDFASKYRNLEKIKTQGYNFVFEQKYNNIRYYWIPIEDLP